jgi:hypothetical protein
MTKKKLSKKQARTASMAPAPVRRRSAVDSAIQRTISRLHADAMSRPMRDASLRKRTRSPTHTAFLPPFLPTRTTHRRSRRRLGSAAAARLHIDKMHGLQLFSAQLKVLAPAAESAGAVATSGQSMSGSISAQSAATLASCADSCATALSAVGRMTLPEAEPPPFAVPNATHTARKPCAASQPAEDALRRLSDGRTDLAIGYNEKPEVAPRTCSTCGEDDAGDAAELCKCSPSRASAVPYSSELEWFRKK